MIVRTEFSYRKVFGPVAEVVARLPAEGGVIADNGCWGHVNFAKACAAAGKKAVLGKRFPWGDRWAVAVPRSPTGLRALYGASGATFDPVLAADSDWFVAFPGSPPASLGGVLPPRFLPSFVPGVVRPLGVGSGANNPYLVAFSDALYPTPGDREAYELMLGRGAESRPGSAHILGPDELILEGATPAQIARLAEVIAECDTPLPKAENIRYPVEDAQAELQQLAAAELIRRGLNRSPYSERLTREFATIGEKKFADYFLVIADMMRYAKSKMLVGPARGSSCGSLVCQMLRITEVDPIVHNLLFERFIDVNRADLPDIDIDFPDTERHFVIEYLREKYGEHNVAQIGTIMRYKPKSALTDIAKHGGVPLWELDKLKDVIIERSSGDMRYRNQLSDSFEQLEVGKSLLAKYPVLAVAGRLEDHARSAGTHAAGIIVCNRPVTEYCGVEDGGAQIDKKMAESLNMLKIDALGLRTLSVIEECCRLIGKSPEDMYNLPLDDRGVFELLNQHKYGCVFQFEGMALQTVAQQITIDCFQDIAALTALCRPGPLSGGETQRWVKGKQTGTINPLHPSLEPYTRNEYGCIIYQEQVMRVCLEIGGFSWADVGKIRNLMSKTVGDEAFAKFGDSFKAGAKKNGVTEEDAGRIWKAINSMGCLAEDTVLVNPFPNHVTPKAFTIKHLANHRGYIRQKKKTCDGMIKRQQLYSLVNNGKIKPKRCHDAYYSGYKITLLLVLGNGMSIRATPNHKFLREGIEWVELRDLKPGDSIAVMGATRLTERKTKKGTGSGGHNWWHKLRAGMPLFKRQVAILKRRFKRCQRCKKRPYQETHHQNMNHSDHAMPNLLPVCRKCHRELHGISVPHSVGKDSDLSAVVFIGKPEKREVYDVSMPAPWNNFVANGIVVHNSWAFNLSHAVAYGIVSYWTAWLKAHHPIEFAVANLRNSRDEDSTKATLREIMKDGLVEFIPVDRHRSTDRWEFADNALLGPLTGIKGCGEKTAREILSRRASGVKLTPRHTKLLSSESKFADYAPTRKRWGHIYDEPTKHFRTVTIVDEVKTLQEFSGSGRFCIIGRLMKKNLRNKNDEKWLARRNGRRVDSNRENYLLFNIEDDTGQMLCCVGADKYESLGKRIVEEAKLESWFAVVGNTAEDFKILLVENVKWLT